MRRVLARDRRIGARPFRRPRKGARPLTKITHEYLNAMARGRNVRVATLFALAESNDPFYARRDSRRKSAEWFGSQYEAHRFAPGVHVRRIHYRLISQETPVLDWNGAPYLNTDKCWNALLGAAKDARYLGVVPLEDFDDRRNPPATVARIAPPDDPEITDSDDGALNDLVLRELFKLPRLGLVAPCQAQPFHVEIWCEKSTMRDILDNIGLQYGVTRVYSLGELSLTACVKLILERVTSNGGRPVRILYLSDFDPAGRSMPVAAARKIEWLIREHDLNIDLQLRPILLDHDQCVHYQLPRTPIKEGESRAAEFEIQFGDGATELDALEALHPGELRNIVTRELDRYFDHTLQERWDSLVGERRDALDAIVADVHAEYEEHLAPHRAEYQRLAWETNHLRVQVGMVFAKMTADMAARAAEAGLLADFSVADREADEDEDPLYDSRRDYFAQLDRYKLFQGHTAEREDRCRAKRALQSRVDRAKKKAATNAAERDASIPMSRGNGGAP
jgi:acyl carrier protein phosphodiesterase